MIEKHDFYISGRWVASHGDARHTLVNPANERPIASIAMADSEDVNHAVSAARAAFDSFSRTTVKERIDLLESILSAYKKRQSDIGEAISLEIGAPLKFSIDVHAGSGVSHLLNAIEILKNFKSEHYNGSTLISYEPIGVCGLITPWNWPLNQIVPKVGPALAAGCTVVLKPSEYSPLSSHVFAEVMHEAGVPAGVFNMINGDGPTAGHAIAAHSNVDMVSVTGSTRAGIAVAVAAAPTIKRVTQELGGKSPNIILADADFEAVVKRGVNVCFVNSGQSCAAPTRMLVQRERLDEAAAIAKAAAEAHVVGDPADAKTNLGPVVNKTQFDRVQRLIQAGIDEGATLVTGGTGRPEGLDAGYFCKPTIFSGVDQSMKIAREEIFGPVLCLMPYDDEDDAIRIANDTEYGLAAHIQGKDMGRINRIASRIRSGRVILNYPPADLTSPFGGYKQSGNGREFGDIGLKEYLEVKAVLGHKQDATQP